MRRTSGAGQDGFPFSGTKDKGEQFVPKWHLGIERQLSWIGAEVALPKVRCEDTPRLAEAYEEAKSFGETWPV